MDLKQREHYETRGYVLLRGLFAEAELNGWEQRFLDLARGAEPPSGMKLMRDVMVARGVVTPADPVHAINKLLMFEQDEVLFSFAQHRGLLRAVAPWVGENPWVIASNVFNKPPEVDGRHPLHQDLAYFRLRPPEKLIAVWTALSTCTRENGCLAVIPGSHRGELRQHALPEWEHVNRGFTGVEADPELREHIEMEPGDTLLFHPLLIHGSGSNLTQSCRRAISVHFAHDQVIAADQLLAEGARTRIRRVDQAAPVSDARTVTMPV